MGVEAAVVRGVAASVVGIWVEAYKKGTIFNSSYKGASMKSVSLVYNLINFIQLSS